MAEPVSGSHPADPARVPSSRLPERPSAEFLRKLAKDRLRALRIEKPDTRLFEAQLLVAREHGFPSWRGLIEQLNAGRRGQLRRTGSRIEIEGIPPLTWSGSDCTYLQCLVSALRVLGPAHDYVRLFGDSGLAFRVRFWTNDAGTGACPSSPVGEMPPWTDLTERSIGWKMRWDVRLQGTPEDPHDMTDLLDEITASIDAGLPVLGYLRSWDLGIIYGYEGSRLLVRDFHVGTAETLMDLSDCRGLMSFFEERTPAPTREESARIGLAEGVSRWTHSPDRRQRGPEAGAYYYGPEAYNRWIAVLEHADGFTPEQRKEPLHVNFWTFISLHDARQKAALYLRSITELFPEGAASLRAAADLYQEIGEITGQVIHDGRHFPCFFLPDSLDRWTPEVRVEERALLSRLRDLDGKAIAGIESALK